MMLKNGLYFENNLYEYEMNSCTNAGVSVAEMKVPTRARMKATATKMTVLLCRFKLQQYNPKKYAKMVHTETFSINRSWEGQGTLFFNWINMKRDLHNLNLGFIQIKRNVHFDSADHDCPQEPPRSE